MYSEKTFKNYIFWIQVKRVVLIILLSCIGAALGVLISEIYESISKSNALNILIIVVSTVVMFLLSLLCTAGTGKAVQEGYWKIAVLRKLTAIQKLIETNNSMLDKKDEITSVLPKEEVVEVINNITEQEDVTKVNETEYEEDEDVQVISDDVIVEIDKIEEKEIIEEKNESKKKKVKEAV